MEAGTYGTGRPTASGGLGRRLTTETKSALKTTEFWAYIGFVIAVLIAGTVDDAEGSAFGADNVWLYVTIATAAYLLSRGLAKSGSRDPYWDTPDAGNSDGLGERVKAAAQVLTEGQGVGDSHRETTPMGRSGGPTV